MSPPPPPELTAHYQAGSVSQRNTNGGGRSAYGEVPTRGELFCSRVVFPPPRVDALPALEAGPLYVSQEISRVGLEQGVCRHQQPDDVPDVAVVLPSRLRSFPAIVLAGRLRRMGGAGLGDTDGSILKPLVRHAGEKRAFPPSSTASGRLCRHRNPPLLLSGKGLRFWGRPQLTNRRQLIRMFAFRVVHQHINLELSRTYCDVLLAVSAAHTVIYPNA